MMWVLVEIHLDDPQIHHCSTGVGFPDTYVLSHVHVHWGPTDSTGSEHSINGQRHTMEMHFVHQKYDHVKNKLADESPTDGLAVIGVMFETDFPMAVNNPHLDPINKVLREVNGSSLEKILHVNHTSIHFFSLLPSDKMALRYKGSLTTPSCSEKVNWAVYETPAKVSQAQIRSFRSLLMPNEKHSRTMLDSSSPFIREACKGLNLGWNVVSIEQDEGQANVKSQILDIFYIICIEIIFIVWILNISLILFSVE